LPRGDQIEKFDPTIGRWFGWAAVVVAALLAVDVVRDGIGGEDAAGLAALLFTATVVYMVMVRPRVVAYENVLTVKNIISDTDLPWSRIESVTRRQTLCIKTDERTVNCVAAPQAAARLMRSGDKQFEFASGIPYQQYVVLKAASFVSQQGPGVPRRAPIVRRWAWPELVVLVLSTAALLAVWLT
jgi:hypothetical protein